MLIEREWRVIALEKNNIKYYDLEAQFEYEQNKLSVREIDISTREGILRNLEKDLASREKKLNEEHEAVVEKKNNLSISLAQYDDAVYLLTERKLQLESIERRLMDQKKKLIESHNDTLNKFVEKEHQLLKKELTLREKYSKLAKELNYVNEEGKLSNLNIDLEV